MTRPIYLDYNGTTPHAPEVIDVMQVPKEWAKGTLHFTTGRYTTAADIDRDVEAVVVTIKKLRA